MKKQTTSRPASKPKPRKTTTQEILINKVQKNVLFTRVSKKTIRGLLPQLTLHTFTSNDIILDEATEGNELYLILKGKVRVKKYTKYGVESLLGILREGDFFGELSLLDGSPRSARIEAIDECRLATLHSSAFRALVNENKTFTSNLLRSVALRLRAIDQRFVSEIEGHTVSFSDATERFNLLSEASKSVNSSLEIDTVLTLILSAATNSIQAERGTLYLLDKTKDELWSKVAHGKNLVEIRLPVGKGLAGHVAKTGNAINISDAYKDPRFNPEIDRKSGYTTRNVLCMPMRDKEKEIVGVFQFLNKRSGSFSHDDEMFIEALSVHASIAIENARLAREMIKTERLSAVGKMAGSIIHDIKNPMSILRINAQIIKGKTSDTETSLLADEMMRQIDRFVKMTQDILDFSRGESKMNIEIHNLGDLLPQIVLLIEKEMRSKNIKIVTDLQETGEAALDLDKIFRVFLNLTANAADAMATGGTLTIRSKKTDTNLIFEFADTGTGIPPAVMEKIFEPFFTHNKKHGTGLGLSIVKKIIEDHQGTIEIESSEKSGTTVRLSLPQEQDQAD